jgi:hypothetical protein
MNSSCAVARRAVFDKGLEINNLWNFNWVLTKDIFLGYGIIQQQSKTI